MNELLDGKAGTACTAYDDLALLHDLRTRGVVLDAEGGDIVLRGNAQALTPDVMARLKSRKQALLDLLRSELAPAGGLPDVIPDPAGRFEPFPLNENQQAYWLGRDASVAFGSVGIHVFFELLIPDFDAARFEAAWNALMLRHDMLRAVVHSDGVQQVLKSVPPFRLEVTPCTNLDAVAENALLDEARDRLSHACYALEHWPQTSFRAFARGDGTAVLMASIDCWCLDGHSLQVLTRELAALYAGETLPPAPACSFRDYVLALEHFRQSPLYAASLAYWEEKVASLPPAPSLPLRDGADSAARPSFRRLEAVLEASEFDRLAARLRAGDITLSTVLLTAYAETLGHWCRESRFTVNVPRVNRLPLHADIAACVGEFASFSLTAADLSDPSQSFLDRCRSMQRQVWRDLEHDHVSGVTVLRTWRQRTGAGQDTGMPYVFTSEPESAGRPGESSWVAALGRMGTVRRTLTQTPQVWIDAQYGRIDNGLHLSWDVLEGRFPDGLPEAMFAAYTRLVRALATDDAAWASPCPLRTAMSEPVCAYSDIAGPSVPVADEHLPDLLRALACSRGDAAACVDEYGTLSWRDLSLCTEGLTAVLRASGLSRGSRVGLALRKGRWQIAAPCAVRTAGGVIVPLDADAPAGRLRALLGDCGASLLLVDEGCTLDAGVPTAVLPAAGLSGININARPLEAAPLAGSELYSVVYTSGSTGAPKGVLIPYKGAANAVLTIGAMAPLGQHTPALSLSPFHHDMAVPDYLGCLLLGMPVVFPDHARRKDPSHWLELMRAHGIGFWNSVPSMMTMLLDAFPADVAFPELRLVALGGDWLPLAMVRALLSRAPNARVVSIGGPTEISMANIGWPVTAVDPAWKAVPYGTPFPNAGYVVLNELGRPVPRGVAGELGCTGPWMALGYLGDADRTARVFTSLADGRRLCRTGDFGRMRDDGVIEFLGRSDNQLKINGYRVEPAEIESVLRSHPGVREAVVLAVQTEGSPKRLCAWLQAGQAAAAPTADEVRAYVLERLPSYMAPTCIGFCATFPLTANGKLDRRAVAAWPLPDETGQSAGFSPSTPSERAVAEAWQRVLGHAPAGGDANFFEAGGDSLAAIRLLNTLRGPGLQGLGVMDIFRSPTPLTLAACLDRLAGGRGGLPPLRPSGRRQGPAGDHRLFPASSAQTRLWIEEQTRPDSRYLLSFRLTISGRVDAKVLEQALNGVIARHEALRTTLRGTLNRNGVCLVEQMVHNRLPLSLQVLDLSDRAPAGAHALAHRLEEAMSNGPVALDRGPLLRAALLLLPDETALRLVFHHAVFDGWSMRLFMESLEDELNGRPAQHCADHPDYPDIADWERLKAVQERVQERLEAMKRGLAGAAAPQMPPFHEFEPEAQEPSQSQIYLERPIPAATAQAMRQLAARAGTTPFLVGLAAFNLTLARHAGENDLLIGTYAAQRDSAELARIVGLLVNPLPLRVRVDEAANFETLLAGCRAAFMEAADNAIVPFDLAVQALARGREPGRHPLFDTAFSQDNTQAARISGSGMTLTLVPGGRHATAMTLDVAMREGASPAFEAVADPAVWTEAALQAFLDRMILVLEQALEDPARILKDISLCSAADMQLLTERGSGAVIAAPWPSLWERFEETALARASEPGLMMDDVTLTFGELHQRSLDWAAAFAASGHPGCAALLMERGPELAAAMLGAWRSGRCVLPISRLQPAARAAVMLEQARPALLVCDTDETPDLSFSLSLLRPADIGGAGQAPPHVRPDSDAAALLLFTSGSSGVPKGVVIGCGALSNRLQWGGTAAPFTDPGPAVAKADMGFIDAATELFAPLLHGCPVRFLPDRDLQRMDLLHALISTHRAARLVAVPGALRALADLCGQLGPLDSVTTLISSGEPLYGPLVRRLRQAFPNARLYNFYGSTEVAGEAAWHALNPEEDRFLVPLGLPVAGTDIVVRDGAGNLLPWGVPGEIVVRGQALALGYLSDGNITDFADGLARELPTRDRGVWSRDGLLLGLGRIDRQIKIRGQRIAPQEVEEALRQLPGVDNAAVFAVEHEDDMLLCACLAGSDAPDDETAAGLLAGRLPPAFVPGLWMRCERLPLTASGKIDGERLRAEALDLLRSGAGAARDEQPETLTPLERDLAGLWRSVLGAVPGRGSNFFLDGGHSLLAVRLAVLTTDRLSVLCEVRDIFERPVFADLAGRLQARMDETTAAETGDAEWEEL